MNVPGAADNSDVFLSYNSLDIAWATCLKTALEQRGIKVWIDRDEIRPGDRFVEALETGMQSCSAFLLVVSARALSSSWVKDEYHRALSRTNQAGATFRLIPVLIEDASLPGFIANRQWVDFRDPSAFDSQVDRLCWGITGEKLPEAGDVRPISSATDSLFRSFLNRTFRVVQKPVVTGIKTIGILLAAIVLLFGALAAVIACWVYIDGYLSSLREQKERALSKYPPRIPFNTGWVFIGYHTSWSWVEGPMAKIVNRAKEPRAGLRGDDNWRLGTLERMVTPLPKPGEPRSSRPVDRWRDPYVDRHYPLYEETIRQQEDLIRFRSCMIEDEACAIPTLGDVLRVSKIRRLIIADFRTKGLDNQMVFPPSVSDPLSPTDETGVEFAVGALLVVRDVQLGAYSDRPAAVWCRVAACGVGIPQCDQALSEAKTANSR